MQDKAVGAFAEAWAAALAASELPVVDLSAAVGTILSAKDEDEVKNIRKAAYLVSSAMNNRGVRDIEGESCLWALLREKSGIILRNYTI